MVKRVKCHLNDSELREIIGDEQSDVEELIASCKIDEGQEKQKE